MVAVSVEVHYDCTCLKMIQSNVVLTVYLSAVPTDNKDAGCSGHPLCTAVAALPNTSGGQLFH